MVVEATAKRCDMTAGFECPSSVFTIHVSLASISRSKILNPKALKMESSFV